VPDRLSAAKGVSGLEKRYPSFDDAKDKNGKVHYYISRAEDFDDYLRRSWGVSDVTIVPEGNVDKESQKIHQVQDSLAPGEVAVFSRPGHTGIITRSYMDLFADNVTGIVHVWILKPKRLTK
jgi:hypothetical protein